ncbi:Crp/Fnr family transcriptional regulator [Rhizobium sp. LjRoot258]|uniref:Crp/Fnr family transcriptional regulator n=1 Tax=Rhizobium sp. LjRoot258 TaxID=3342299 RepID=UPI003ECEADC3
MSVMHEGFQNRVLRSLPERELNMLSPNLISWKWSDGDVIFRAGQTTDVVFLPDNGILALFARAGVKSLAVGAVGKEGMLDAAAVVLDTRPRFDVVALTPGSGHQIEMGPFRELTESSQALQKSLLAIVATMQAVIASTAVANGHGSIEQRLARWILMCQDRVGDVFRISHRVLAEALGSRRPGVTVALHALEGDGLIRSRRLEIEVRDRRGLEMAAGAFYDGAEAASAHPRQAGDEVTSHVPS